MARYSASHAGTARVLAIASARPTSPYVVFGEGANGSSICQGECRVADVLEILSTRNKLDGRWASLEHFRWRDGGEVPSEIVIRQDHLKPYCLDHASRRLIFAENPPGTDLTSVAFAFAEQKRLARRLIAVPYGELPELARRVPTPKRVISIFNASRSGTTLMSQILNQVDGIASFAELDFFTNVWMLAERGEAREELAEVLSHCVTLFAYPHADQIVGFKFRHNCVGVADLFHEALPTAKNLFMYRNALDWSASWWRLLLEWSSSSLSDIDIAAVQNEWLHVSEKTRTTYLDRLMTPQAKTIPAIVGKLLEWIDSIEGYLEACERGVPLFAFRYEDLNGHRRAMLEKVFEYVGIPLERLPQAMRGFERDAQAGTVLQRKDGMPNTLALDDGAVRNIVDALRRHPRELAPDLVLPGTVLPR